MAFFGTGTSLTGVVELLRHAMYAAVADWSSCVNGVELVLVRFWLEVWLERLVYWLVER